MTLSLPDLAALSEADLVRLRREKGDDWYAGLLAEVATAYAQARQEHALEFHECKNPMARPLHRSTAREVAVNGGNRSSKTSELLAELAIQTTGVIPESPTGVYPREKLRGPIRARVVCNSLTDTLGPIILPKLDYRQWNGVGDPLEGRGHYGWIPKLLLRNAKWESAWQEKARTLHVGVSGLSFAGGHELEIRYWSSIQFLSYDQELSAFAGASMHLVIHDEVPPRDIYRENRTRTLDVKGQLLTGFTPPDEPGASRGDISWFYDEVYTKGLPGPQKAPDLETITLFTEANTILDPAEVAAFAARLTPEQREVRLHGKFLHLAGLVLPEFVTYEATWCFRCVRKAFVADGACVTCGGTDLEPYSHLIEPFEIPKPWPLYMTADPHPRKPTTLGWFAVTPADDVLMVAEAAVEGEAGDVRRVIDQVEGGKGWRPVLRLADPNIIVQTQQIAERGWTMRREFDRAGIHFGLANDSLETGGLDTLRQYLKVDPKTRRPRLQLFRTCERTAHALTRWVWEDWKRASEKEPKERVGDTGKDWADLVRYACNERPTFGGLKMRGAAAMNLAGPRPAAGY